MSPLLIILLIVCILGVPGGAYYGGPRYGYGFGGLFGVVLLVVVVLALMGRL